MTQAFNLSQLANFVNSSGQLDAALGLTNTGGLASFPSGTRMSFQQTTAPTGWTKDTTAAINDAILRLVTGTVGSGGTNAFSTFNAQSVVGSTTLSTSQIPSHSHGQGGVNVLKLNGVETSVNGATETTTGSTGGGGSHNHSITTAIKYYDFIIASKN